MSGSSEKAWSDNPNAPQIPYGLYLFEKDVFAGNSLGALFYGIAAVLFFQCMGALLYPVDRKRGGIKWGLVTHTTTMFLVLTVNAALTFDIESIAYVDNREFPTSHVFPPGPPGYQDIIYTKAITVVPNVMSFLNLCLADGFLLYRCYVIYSMNYWVVLLPCLMYLASLALSIVIVYYQTTSTGPLFWDYVVTHLELPCYAISLTLNVLLTFMIATRLIRHRRNIRNAIGPATDGGLYNTVVTILVESCVLYAVASLLFIGPLAAESSIQGIFAPIFGNVQVIGPFLIILRVANRTALTSDTVASGKLSSIRFKSRGESTGGSGALPDKDPVSSIETDGESRGEPGAEADNTIEEVPL